MFFTILVKGGQKMKKITAYKVNNLSKVDTRFYVEGDHFLTDRSVGILTNGKIKTIQGNENIEAHITNKENPHEVTKEQVGLRRVQDYRDATKEEAEKGTSKNLFMTPANTKSAIDKQVPNLEIIKDLVNRVEQLEGVEPVE